MAPHRRQRWRCHPLVGPSHRFFEFLPREEAHRPACSDCSNKLEPWEGQNGAHEYWYMARPIAHCLALVARGESYRRAAFDTRRLYLHIRSWQPRRGMYRRSRYRVSELDGQVAANWVDVFTPALTDGVLPTEWPERIAADSAGFFTSGNAQHRAGMSWHALCVVGYERGSDRPKLWKLVPSPDRSSGAWAHVFNSLPGTPARVVSDDAAEIRSAASRVFPRPGDPAPDIRLCESHLARNLEMRIPAAVRSNSAHPLMRALRGALRTTDGWNAFLQEVRNLQGAPGLHTAGLRRFLQNHARRIQAQIPSRPWEGPHSTGATESVLTKLGDALHMRDHVMTNLPRAEKLLQLFQLGVNGQIDEVEWAEKIRQDLITRAGYAPLHQRPHDDASGSFSLIS